MEDSLVRKYFDFGQALEFLKQGTPVTNELYTDKFRYEKEVGVIYLTNYVSIENGKHLDINGLEAFHEVVYEIDIDDILNEKWFIYEN